MKHLLNKNSEIIITSQDYELRESGKVYKDGDEIFVKQKCQMVKFQHDEYDGYGNNTGNTIAYIVQADTIRELCKRFDEIENMQPIKSQYSTSPF